MADKERHSGESELVIARLLDAPRELVWQAWTERDRALHWYGPKDFTTPELEMDLRPGGAWRAVIRGPDGAEHPQHGVYREVVPPERLVFTFAWGDEPDHEMLVTITLVERGDRTEMTFRQAPFTSADSRDSHSEGWNESFERLETFLDGVRRSRSA